jgi:hypothetical protein
MGCASSRTEQRNSSQNAVSPQRSKASEPKKEFHDDNPMDPTVALFFRQFHEGQMAGANPMSLLFDKSEFTRKVDENFIANAQISAEQQQEVDKVQTPIRFQRAQKLVKLQLNSKTQT